MAYTKTESRSRTYVGTAYQDGNSGSYTEVLSGTETRTGQRVPRFASLIKEGRDANSTYSRSSTLVLDEMPAGYTFSGYGGPPYLPFKKGFTGVMYSNQGTSTLPQAKSADNAALVKLYAKIQQQRSEMNGLLFLGELRESIRMIRNPAKSMMDALSDYAGTARRLRRNYERKLWTYQRFHKALAGLWLEAQFGWKPLISDIESASQAAARILHGNASRRTRVRSSSESQAVQAPSVVTVSVPVTAPYHSSGPTGKFSQEIRRKSTVTVRYTAGLATSLEGPADSLSRVGDVLGVTLENFIPTLYNLVPYSFLVDYFANIGDIITAGCTDTSNVVWATKSVLSRDETECLQTFDRVSTLSHFSGYGYSGSVSGKNGSSKTVRRSYTRNSVILGLPSLEFTIPGEDSLKWANMYALFVSGLSGNHRK